MAQTSKVTYEFGGVRAKERQEIPSSSSLIFGTDVHGMEMAWSNSSTTLSIDPTVANYTVRIGQTTQANVQIDGAAGDLHFNNLSSALTLGGANYYIPVFVGADRAQVIAAGANSGNSAINMNCVGTQISVDAGGDRFYLTSGVVPGQIKEIVMDHTAGGTANIECNGCSFSNSLSFIELTHANSHITFMWSSSNTWIPIAARGATYA